jgi:hypothetical protein
MNSRYYDKIVGFTGHQELSAGTRENVQVMLLKWLSSWEKILGVTSLAAGSDQIFAECVLASSGQLLIVIPSHGYEGTFDNPVDLATYQELSRPAIDRIQLAFKEPSEAAYWAAGKRIVDMSDTLVAVWDGQPAGGLGGTAHVVAYAKKHNKEVVRIWPPGASRT